MSTRAASAAANAAAELAEANYSVNATIENESLDFQASYAEVMIKMGLRLDPIKFAAERSAPFTAEHLKAEHEAMSNLCSLYWLPPLVEGPLGSGAGRSHAF